MAKPYEIVTELSADAIESSHTLATRVEVLVNEEVEEVITDVLDGTVTLDATAAVRGRLDLTIAGIEELIPTGPDALLAPYGNEIRVYRGVELAHTIELVSLGIFRIDRATVPSDTNGEMIRIAGQDRAARFSGNDGAFETAGQTDADRSLYAIIGDVLYPVWPDLPIDNRGGGEFEFAPRVVYQEGDSRWDFLQGMAEAAGCELYFNREGILTIRQIITAVSGAPVAEITEGGTLISAERAWDRDQVYNQVLVTGESTSESTPARGAAYDADPLSPTYIYGKFGRKTYFQSFSTITTNTQAQDCAQGILARTMGAPDIVNFEAVVDPARSPSDVIRVTREQVGLTHDHVLDSVSIPLSPSGTMTATTRATSAVL